MNWIDGILVLYIAFALGFILSELLPDSAPEKDEWNEWE